MRNSILCPNCNKLISSDEPRCPHCGMGHPGAFWKNNPLMRMFSNGEGVIRSVIFVNIGLYILSLFLLPISLNLSSPFNALAPNFNSLLLLGASGTIPIDKFHHWWSLVSAGFLHSSLLHIVFNMIAFRHLGLFVLRLYGPHRMMIIYIMSGVIGYLISYLAGVRMTIGASASVCGLIGAILFYGKSRGGVFGEAIFQQTVGWLVGLLLIGLMPNINNWGTWRRSGGRHFNGIHAGLSGEKENFFFR